MDSNTHAYTQTHRIHSYRQGHFTEVKGCHRQPQIKFTALKNYHIGHSQTLILELNRTSTPPKMMKL